jgi:hypothetical protein
MIYEKPQLVGLTENPWEASGLCAPGVSNPDGACNQGRSAKAGDCLSGEGVLLNCNTGTAATTRCTFGESASGTNPSCEGGFYAVGGGGCKSGGGPSPGPCTSGAGV